MNGNIRDFNKTETKHGLNEGADKIDEANQQLSTAAAAASAKLGEYGINTDVMVDKAIEKKNDMQEAFADAIRNSPLRSVAIAAGFGFLYALSRR